MERKTGLMFRPSKQLLFRAREHNSSGQHMRVWRNDWFSDQFEILSRAEYEMLKVMLSRFNIDIEDVTGED